MKNRQSGINIPEPSNAAIRLLACISRFEFALKEIGCVEGEEGARVGASWAKLKQQLDETSAVARLWETEAVRPLIQDPPKKQLRRGDGFEWGDPQKVTNLTELGIAIRQVRNNLFHGGKEGDNPRDDILCEAATAAILVLVEAHPAVRNAFEGNY